MEIWKDVTGYEGRYQVSDHGRVKSLSRTARAVSKAGNEYQILLRERVLKDGDCRGHRIVHLSPSGTKSVHRLVAAAFVPGWFPGAEVNHRDGNKRNNHASNLEWVTHRGNREHAVATGLCRQSTPVINPQTGQVFPSISQAAKAAGCRHTTVSKTWKKA